MNLSIGNKIKTLRKQRGITQEQLADSIGISFQAVSKWENNQSCPDISVLPDLADVFGISVDELLGKGGAAREAEVVDPDEEKEESGYK